VRDANYLREQAKRCRALAKTAVEPDIIEQLRLWSVELADEADAVERQGAESEETCLGSRQPHGWWSDRARQSASPKRVVSGPWRKH